MKPDESDPRWNLVQRYADGHAGETEVEKLEDELTKDPGFRQAFLAYLNLDAALEGSLLQHAAPGVEEISKPKRRAIPTWLGLAASIAILIAGAWLGIRPFQGSPVAEVGEVTRDTRWLSPPLLEGDGLQKGNSLQLASGSVEIRFQSGALTRLHGPAQFEILSGNSGFLSYGEAYSRADNEESKGFTIETHSGDFVDQGTEFLTTASPDGFSQLHVTSGAVDVDVPGMELQRLRKGSGLGIEPGEVPVLIRIEQGNETPAFAFPTIPPPGRTDYADASQGAARVQWWPTDQTDENNHPSPKSGPFELLLDGKGQTGDDHPSESVFFRDGANGLILLDLGKEVSVSKIHTYSWHRNREDPDLRRRAVQRYTLWGCGAELPDSLPLSGNGTGWTRIARVNTDAFFRVKKDPDRPAQQACAIFSGENAIGTFRYLLFEVAPTPMPEGFRPRHTFLGEIDVFASETSSLPR